MAKRRINRTPKKTRHDWKPKFLEALAEDGVIISACKVASVAPSTVYKHRDEDESFALAMADAIEQSTQNLESEGHHRARHGTGRVVLHQGQPVFVSVNEAGEIVPAGTVNSRLVPLMEHQKSDTLLIFLLKARRPGVYRDRVEHTVVTPDPTDSMTDAELDAEIARRQAEVARTARREKPTSGAK